MLFDSLALLLFRVPIDRGVTANGLLVIWPMEALALCEVYRISVSALNQ